MITVRKVGRTGNNMFQYAFSRLIAEKSNLHYNIDTSVTDSFPIDVTPYNNDGRFDLLTDDIIHFDGYYQDPRIYDANRELVKSFFKINHTKASLTKTIRKNI